MAACLNQVLFSLLKMIQTLNQLESEAFNIYFTLDLKNRNNLSLVNKAGSGG